MNLQELAELMGKSEEEVKEILEKNEVIELKLSERNKNQYKDKGTLEVIK